MHKPQVLKKGIYIWIFLLRKEQQLCLIIHFGTVKKDFPEATMQQLRNYILQKMCFYFENSSIRLLSHFNFSALIFY